MRKSRIISTLAIMAVVLTANSCQKDKAEQIAPEGEKMNISIRGDFAEFSDDDTKASVQSVFRMTWTNGDNVYVFGKASGSSDVQLLGTLLATVVEDTGDRVADLAGTLDYAPESGTKLTLIYSPEFTSAPSISSNAVSVDLSAQSGAADHVTFVAYATVDPKPELSSTYRTSFNFATNVLRVNASCMDEGIAITNAVIDGIETKCQIAISSVAEPTITGITDGSITRTITGSTNSKGNLAFYVALPINTASTSRSISISGTESKFVYSSFATSGQSLSGRMMNTIASEPITYHKYIENSVDLGYGTYIPETGVVWAPFNCGYDATNYKYGKFYQFGRAKGSGYAGETPDPALDDAGGIIQTYYTSSPETTTDPEDGLFYQGTSGTHDWYGASPRLTRWPNSPKDYGYLAGKIASPCPSGWRVPTYDEMLALVGGNSTPTLVEHNGQMGVWFNGTPSPGTNGVFLQAAGYRKAETGITRLRGAYGFYWTSYVESSGYALGIENGGAAIDTQYRVVGFSVRCVHD